MTGEDKLSPKEKINIATEAGIAAIPHLGGSLQALYFGTKNEKRFKRIERFYDELHIEIEEIKDQFPDELIVHNENQFLGIIEIINDEVEKASSQSKIVNYKKAYKNLLLNSDKRSFDNEQFFIQILPNLTELELKILYQSNKNKHKLVRMIDFYDFLEEETLVKGSVNKLVNYGLVKKFVNSILHGGHGVTEDAYYNVNDLGSEFIRFIFE